MGSNSIYLEASYSKRAIQYILPNLFDLSVDAYLGR